MINDNRHTTAEGVYGILKSRILNLTYKPGYPLSASMLSQELQLSRSPVREALIKLSTEKLVEIFPQIGTRVSLIDLDKVSEERFLRKSLEESAIIDFIPIHNPSNLKYMQSLVINQKEALANKDIIEFLKKDNEFHEVSFKAINKLSCWELASNFSGNERRLRLLSLSSIGGTQDSVLKAHTDLITAISIHDTALALTILRQHLARISDEISNLISVYPEIFTYNDGKSRSRYPKKNSKFPEHFLSTVEKFN